MPWLSMPRNLLTLIRKGFPSSSGGNSAPTMAHGTLMPARALGAPQTIVSNAVWPTSTVQTRRRSALGCCTVSLTSPTTMFINPGTTGLSSSTSRPAMVSVSASCSVESGGLQNSRNQDSGNCIVNFSNRFLLELRQKADIAVKKQAQVIHPVAQHGEPVRPHAKGKANVFLGVQPHVAHDVGMHLTGTGPLQPAASQRTALELDINFGTGFGEWKKTRAKAQYQVIQFKEGAAKIGKDILEIFEADVFTYP